METALLEYGLQGIMIAGMGWGILKLWGRNNELTDKLIETKVADAERDLRFTALLERILRAVEVGG